MLESGADINAAPGLDRGRTAIQAASASEMPTMELVEVLLEAGADINAPAGSDGGVTALQGAAIRGHMKIALKFLEAGQMLMPPQHLSEGELLLMALQSMVAWIGYRCFSKLGLAAIQPRQTILIER